MKALITGITGQDGSYLAEFLLDMGYEVHGVVRRASVMNRRRIDHLHIPMHYGDLQDGSSLNKIIREVKPDEIYNLGAQSHVRVSFDIPEYTGDITGLGSIRLLEAIRETDFPAKFYQASSSELFGKVTEIPQTERTPFYPRSPYGVAKAYAFYMTRNYREAYNMFACNGILFNHESPRRGETFVTRKITMGLAQIEYGLQECLYLGNLDAKRDWGFAGDFVKAMWLMMQKDQPDDYVIATGETHSVREFVERACYHVGLPIRWEGEGLNEVGLLKGNDKPIIKVDPVYFRPTEVDLLLGDPTKAKLELNWKPEVNFEQLVEMMVQADLKEVRNDSRS